MKIGFVWLLVEPSAIGASARHQTSLWQCAIATGSVRLGKAHPSSHSKLMRDDAEEREEAYEDSLKPENFIGEIELAQLWSGYGTISRQTYRRFKDQRMLTVIKKRVCAPLRPGDEKSHIRKVRSYAVERYFYRQLRPLVHGAHVPFTYHHTDTNSIIMEDLACKYKGTVTTVDFSTAKLVVSWLANFHASFWQVPVETISVEPTRHPNEQGVWEEGGYWVLRTREEEYACLTEAWQKIAQEIDAEIRNIESSYTTLIHGDCKTANVAIDRLRTKCALYDFQYVGRGPGVRDLVYFFISSVSDIERHEQALLEHYYSSVVAGLAKRGLQDQEKAYTRELMDHHYELCLVDYYRFMLGWGMWGDSNFARKRTLDILKGRL